MILRPQRIKLLEDKTNLYIEIITDYLPWITQIQYTSFLVLFICLIRIPSLILVTLSKEIYSRESATAAEMNQLIVKWKKSYVLVCDLVAEMNAFLGLPIFIFFIMSMIIFINMVFAIFVDILRNDLEFLDVNLLMISNSLVWNGILIFVSDQIHQQVSKIDIIIKKHSNLWAIQLNNQQVSNVVNRLRHLNVPDNETQNQVCQSLL